MDPIEKIRFHVTRARATNKMDLSTWANRRQGDFLLSRVPRTVRKRSFILADKCIRKIPPSFAVKFVPDCNTRAENRLTISLSSPALSAALPPKGLALDRAEGALVDE